MGKYETLVFTHKICYTRPMPIIDPPLKAFLQALEDTYGSQVERTVLFGSRARGDAKEGSDYDLAVFMKDMKDRWDEIDRLAELGLFVFDKTGGVVNALPYLTSAYNDDTDLMSEIRREGVEV